MSAWTPRRLYQCPGCWSYGSHRRHEGGYVQCDCGEKMTLVDLRARTRSGGQHQRDVTLYEDER